EFCVRTLSLPSNPRREVSLQKRTTRIILFISQDEDQLHLKQETDTLMEIPNKEHENSEADLKNRKSFNVTDSQDEEGNQHEESTSTTDEWTDPQNRDQRKRRDRSHVQSVASSHLSESQCYIKGNRNATDDLVKGQKEPQKERINSSINSGTKLYVCKECGKSFRYVSQFRIHIRVHTGKKPFSCKVCDRSFSRDCSLKRHMRSHTGDKPFSCKECDKSFLDVLLLSLAHSYFAIRASFSHQCCRSGPCSRGTNIHDRCGV
uniref:C2H2-type domain-containing protein n=1 Tax=Oryzias latipes TaxID=8090 RepID=A0A3P9HTX0_ORYLA